MCKPIVKSALLFALLQVAKEVRFFLPHMITTACAQGSRHAMKQRPRALPACMTMQTFFACAHLRSGTPQSVRARSQGQMRQVAEQM
jgi:hypothetical protein